MDTDRLPKQCERCLYERQARRTEDQAYLSEVRQLLEARRPEDTAPYLAWKIQERWEARFGKAAGYAKEKRQYNDLVLSMEGEIRRAIRHAPDPLARALAYARSGNYIDFSALSHVDPDTFLALLAASAFSREDERVFRHLVKDVEHAESFLLLADNCGEIVLDRLFLEVLHEQYPDLRLYVMVRGGEIVNDATLEDAIYAGVDRLATLLTNGAPLAGTVRSLLEEASAQILEEADVILAKGQGNYESLWGEGLHIYYAFLCKCERFTQRFGVPALTGVLVEETGKRHDALLPVGRSDTGRS